MLRPLALPLTLGVLALPGCGGGDGDSSSPAGDAATTPSSESNDQVQRRSGCEEVDAPRPRPNGGAERPGARLAPDRLYQVVLQTNCGRIAFRLDQAASPTTAASFAGLVRAGFLDGTVFHRIVPGFVIQGGDPTGTGTGGPGYSTRDVPPSDTAYTKGVVAMAKAAAEPPGTAGSQFYIVTAPDAGLPPEYALLGEVTAGLGRRGDRQARRGIRRGPPAHARRDSARQAARATSVDSRTCRSM